MMNNDNSEVGSGSRTAGAATHCTQKTNNPQWPRRNLASTYRAERENYRQIPLGELAGRDGYGIPEASRCNKP